MALENSKIWRGILKHVISGLSLKIHCWGGFGSQLFGLLQYRNLNSYYPGRQIKIVFHSSGVTRRQVEIKPFLLGVSWQFVDDFISPTDRDKEGASKGKFNNWKTIIKDILKDIIKSLGFLVELETKADMLRIKPWTLSIRGHYSHFEYNESQLLELLADITTLSSITNKSNYFSRSLVVQYRLGDLINLPSKGFVAPKTINRQIKALSTEGNSIPKILFLTDSPMYLSQLESEIDFTFHSELLSPIDTIVAGLEAKQFIGTNSKLSLFIATFRGLLSEASIMPLGFQKQLLIWVPRSQLVKFYAELD